MYYFDLLRVRGALRTYAIVLGVILLVVVVSLPLSHLTTMTSSHGTSHNFTMGLSSDAGDPGQRSGLALLHDLGANTTFPFDDFCQIAIVFSILFATALSISLTKSNETALFTFVKPISRQRATLLTFAIDSAAIVVAFLIALLVLLIPFAEVGLLDRISFASAGLIPATVGFGLGIALMWYAMCQALAATLTRGGAILGISWGSFMTLRALGQFQPDQIPDPVYRTIYALNEINPVWYLQLSFSKIEAGVNPFLDPSYLRNFAIVWLVVLVGLTIATMRRTRMEV